MVDSLVVRELQLLEPQPLVQGEQETECIHIIDKEQMLLALPTLKKDHQTQLE